MVLGAPDTGKTTFARQLATAALAAGKTVAIVDSDIDQTTIGPPTCVGLRFFHQQADLSDVWTADELRFVGGIKPDGLVLQHVVATAALANIARAQVDLVVVDTSGAVSGVIGQTLKYHKTELCRPEVVVALQHGDELGPLTGLLRRFFQAAVEEVPALPITRPASPDERAARRRKSFELELQPPLQAWRVRHTVFAPTLPAGLDLHRLDSMLVGLHDGDGHCLGLGVLEEEEGVLRVLTNRGEGMRGLRLGSIKLDRHDYSLTPVRLREVMFGI
jgi:polynucleotide 5'-hydroxyl-kinase GRC3/NOL9